MKNALLAFLCLTAAMGCGFLNNLSNSSGSNANNSTNRAPSPDRTPTPANSPTAKPSKEASTLIPMLRKSAGKYPYEIKLIENADLKARLTKLLGKDFADFKANFSVQSPIEIEGDIFKSGACQAHNCGNNYFLFVDLKNDNINVFHIDNDMEKKHYFENGEIKLPAKFAEALANNEY